MTYHLYCFHPGRCLVRSVPLHDQGSIEHIDQWIRAYNLAEGISLIRAILGPNELVVLQRDDALRIPSSEFAAPSGGRK